MIQADLVLIKLCRFMTFELEVPSATTRQIRLEQTLEQDNANKKDPRVFCYVTPRSPVIRCTLALNWLPPEFLTGILLHELGHMTNNFFGGNMSEVDVDEWCTKLNVGYQYADCDYMSPWTGRSVIATSIEKVGQGFLKHLERYSK